MRCWLLMGWVSLAMPGAALESQEDAQPLTGLALLQLGVA